MEWLFYLVKMNIPAYASSNLRIGRSYDAQNSNAGIDIYPSGNIDIEVTNVNQFSFEYRVIKNSRDTKDLLKIPGALSLKVKAGFVSVGGAHLILSLHDKPLSLYFVLTYRALSGLSFPLLKDPPYSGYYVN